MPKILQNAKVSQKKANGIFSQDATNLLKNNSFLTEEDFIT